MRTKLTRLIALTICLFMIISAFSGIMIYSAGFIQHGSDESQLEALFGSGAVALDKFLEEHSKAKQDISPIPADRFTFSVADSALPKVTVYQAEGEKTALDVLSENYIVTIPESARDESGSWYGTEGGLLSDAELFAEFPLVEKSPGVVDVRFSVTGLTVGDTYIDYIGSITDGAEAYVYVSAGENYAVIPQERTIQVNYSDDASAGDSRGETEKDMERDGTAAAYKPAVYADIDDESDPSGDGESAASAWTATAYTGFGNAKETIDLTNATHFIFRHWHTEPIRNTSFQKSSEINKGANRYFVVLEGYIVPTDKNSSDDPDTEEFHPENGDQFKFYLVYQDEGDYVEKGHRYKNDMERVLPDGKFVTKKNYVYDIDQKTGTITLKANPASDEFFSGFSASAGQNAITQTQDNDDDDKRIDTFAIEYDKYTRLVKGHVFYIKTNKVGTADAKVFTEEGIASDPGQDTAWVYTYAIEGEDSDGVLRKAGEIVKDSAGELITEESLSDGNYNGLRVALTKVYDTSEGLHTDKTASLADEYEYVLDENGDPETDEYGDPIMTTVPGDGRTFNVDLESWYSEGYAPRVGMVLDASGSMAFAADKPEPIHLSDKQIETLGINKLTTTNKPSGSSEDSWKGYFLDDTQLNQVLNPRNTDNTRLSVNGYSYFVYSGTDYDPLGYWEGVESVPQPVALLEFNKGSYNTTYERDWLLDSITGKQATKVERANPATDSFAFPEATIKPDDAGRLDWPNDDMKYSGSDGFNVAGSNAGILLDVVPDGDFTLTFKTKMGANNKKLSELLYIGPRTGDANSNYLRFFRPESGSQNRFKASNPPDTSEIININNTLNPSGSHTIALVFKKKSSNSATLDVYVDGGRSVDGNGTYTANIKLDGCNIILNGLEAEVNQNSGYEVFIDEFTMYDTALTEYQVKSLVNGATGVPGTATTWDGRTLASINYQSSDTTTSITRNNTAAGWYFITHAGSYYNHYLTINTGKRMYGISKSTTVADTTTLADGTFPGNKDNNTGNTYAPAAEAPIRFYVDAEGYLRCFYSTSDTVTRCSYVYELGDSEYVRAEALQRTLGIFTTELHEQSPNAEVSAVRFSTNSINDGRVNTSGNDLDKLVLLDWTSDTYEVAQLMSLKRGGTDEALSNDVSTTNNLPQYNYGLTGGTSTWRGLKAFEDKLHPYDHNSEDNDDGRKYLIIFTDGADDQIGDAVQGGLAEEYANNMKDAGYTVFTVLLDGGTMTDGDYERAHTFLLTLSGNNVSGTDPEDYFFSVKEAKEELAGEITENMNDTDILTKIFVQDILDEITQPLQDYKVTDYIDPRFDLVDAGGALWQLKADGYVVKGTGEDAETIKVGTGGVRFVISDESGDDDEDQNPNPLLYYDAEKDMYYLEWENQKIPASTTGAIRISTWSARIKIRAKENFIGGNTIPTNGNAEKENYVRSMNDTNDGFSDTDHAGIVGNTYTGTDSDSEAAAGMYPSKGFPRVTVNVPPVETGSIGEDTVYMGESLSLNEIIAQFMEYEGSDDLDDLTSGIYWEYILRYAKHNTSGIGSAELLKVFEAAEDGGKRSFLIPYYYLPNDYEEKTHDVASQNGTALHMADCLGYLKYTWNVGKRRYPEGDNLVKDTIRRDSELNVKFIPFDEDQRCDIANNKFSTSYFKEIVTDDDDSIDENLLSNILTMVLGGSIKTAISDRGLDDDAKQALSDEILGKLSAKLEEGIIAETNQERTITDVLHEAMDAVLIEYMDTDEIQGIKDAVAAGDILNMHGADLNNYGGSGLIVDTAYKWSADYKPAAGDALDVQDAVIDRMTKNVVSGEVALQIDIDKDSINALLDSGKITSGTKITYSADLAWNGKTIGAFTYEYEVEGYLTGNKIVYAALTLTDADFIHDYGSHPLDNGWHRDIMHDANGDEVDLTNLYNIPTYGLPIGTYTIKNVKASADTGSKNLFFFDMKSIDITDENEHDAFDENNTVLDSKEGYYEGNTLTFVYPDYSEFPAATNGKDTAYLGGSGNDTDLESRYAIFSISFIRVPELPEAGGLGIVLGIIAGIALLFVGRKMMIANRSRRVS